MEQKSLLPIWQLLDNEGLSVDRMEGGRPVVIDKDGNEFDVPVEQLLQRDGLDAKDVEIEWTSPDKPIQTSPLSAEERTKLSFGNAEGSLKFLKERFQDVSYHKDNGFSVKKDGAWYAVDPNMLGKGDAWEKTKNVVAALTSKKGLKEFGKDVAELGPETLNMSLTGLGTALATPVALAAVATGVSSPIAPAALMSGAAAGGLAAGTIRTSLGRMWGTYDPGDANEQAFDVGLEALLSAGGQGVALAARPAVNGVITAAKNVKNWASEVGRDLMTSYIARMTNAGMAATDTLIENAPQVMGRVKTFVNSASNAKAAIEKAAQSKIAHMEKFLSGATTSASTRYGTELQKIIGNLGDDFTVNLDDVSKQIFQSLEGAGLGSFKELTKKSAETGEREAVARGFRVFGEAARVGRIEKGVETLSLIDAEKAQLKPVLGMIKRFANRFGKSSTGEDAGYALREFNKNLNSYLGPLFESDSGNLNRIAGIIKDSYTNIIQKKFEEAGQGAAYSALNQNHFTFVNAVNVAKKALRGGSREGVELFLNDLMALPGKKAGKKGVADTLKTLVGSDALASLEKAMIDHAAEKFIPNAPKMGIVSSVATGWGAAQLLGPAAAAPAAAAVFGSSIPRVTGKLVQGGQALSRKAITPVLEYGSKLNQFLMSKTPEQLKELLSNEALLGSAIGATLNAMRTEGQLTDELLEKANNATMPQQ